MSITSKHPSYTSQIEEWISLRDAYDGEKVVKAKREAYLPATSGMIKNGMSSPSDLGHKEYEAYISRAIFPDYMIDAVEAFTGLACSTPPNIEVPDSMKAMLEKITLHGEPVETLYRKIINEVLKTGRVGLLADLPAIASHELHPYIVIYSAESAINWSTTLSEDGLPTLSMVVLDETGYSLDEDGFDWSVRPQRRVLKLLSQTDGSAKSYASGVFEEEYVQSEMVDFLVKGQKYGKIPFCFVNSTDTTPDVSRPPLSSLAKICFAIYRGEADYRQSLYMQGQDTLVLIGERRKTQEEDAVQVGAGATIELDIGGDAKYIGVSSQGLGEMRTALENDRHNAESLAGRFVMAGAEKESGEAIKTRQNAQTASLKSVCMTAASGLETILRNIAEWVGADVNAVKVTPNLEFHDIDVGADDIVKLTSARSMGAPISKQTIHSLMRERNITSLTYEDEQALVEEEMADQPSVGGDGSGVADANL